MSKLSSNAQLKIAELKQEYIAALPEKLDILKDSWKNIAGESCDEKSINIFRTACHKLAGSAGSYGLKNISNTARGLEKLCNELDESNCEMNHVVKTLQPTFQKLIMEIEENILH